jgi:hypothetical protein
LEFRFSKPHGPVGLDLYQFCRCATNALAIVMTKPNFDLEVFALDPTQLL